MQVNRGNSCFTYAQQMLLGMASLPLNTHIHCMIDRLLCLCRHLLGKLADIVRANMAELGSQRAAFAAAGTGKEAVVAVEKQVAQLEAGTVLEPYTGEDLKEILKAAEVSSHACRYLAHPLGLTY